MIDCIHGFEECENEGHCATTEGCLEYLESDLCPPHWWGNESICKICGANKEAMMVKEILIGTLVIHPWVRKRHKGAAFSCDYWDCPNKIQDDDFYCLNLYPDSNVHTYCLECSCFFMVQAINTMMGEEK